MKWFGSSWCAPICDPGDQVATPVGIQCVYCGEKIVEGDQGVFVFGEYGRSPEHRVCFVRQIVGSVAHVQRRCSCYVRGASEGDPPEMTLREAATLAVEVFEKSRRFTR